MSSLNLVILAPFKPLETLLCGIATGGVPSVARTVYKGRNNVYAMPMAAVVEGFGTFEELNIKEFRIPHIVNRIVYGNFRRGKASKAFDNALRLIQMDIRTPEPVGYAEVREGLLFGRSYFLSEQLPPEWKTLRFVEKTPQFPVVAQALARFMVHLHGCGVWMKDFSSGNVMMKDNGSGEYSFALIDINRMDFDVSDRSRLMSNFEGILDSVEAVEVLAREYALASGIPEACAEYNRIIREATSAFRKRVAKVRRKKKIKRILFAKK